MIGSGRCQIVQADPARAWFAAPSPECVVLAAHNINPVAASSKREMNFRLESRRLYGASTLA